MPKDSKTKIDETNRDWRLLINEFTKSYQIPKEIDDIIKGEFSNKLLERLDVDFDSLPNADYEKYSPLHFEPLLEEAIELLDGCAAIRSSWNENAIQLADFMTEILEFISKDVVQSKESDAGFYRLKVDEIRYKFDSESEFIARSEEALTTLTANLDNNWSREAIAEQKLVASLNAEVSSKELHEAGSHRNYVQHETELLGKKTKPQHVRRYQEIMSEHRLKVEHASLKSRIRSLEGAISSAAKRRDGYEQQLLYAENEMNFLRRRYEIDKRLIQLKMKMLLQKNGIVNYPARKARMKEIFENDFLKSIQKLLSVAVGMKEMMGYQNGFPKSGKGSFFDECEKWADDALEYLRIQSRADQLLVLPISLRSYEQDKFNAGRRKGIWEFTVFDEEERGTNAYQNSLAKFLKNFWCVRLRGMSAYVNLSNGGTGATDAWQLLVRLPAKGYVRRKDGTLVNLTGQDWLPPVSIGRAMGSYRDFVPDKTGVKVLHNASPFGKWRVELADRSTHNRTLDKVEDLQLDLHLIVQATSQP